MLSYHVLVSVPTRVQEFVNAPDLKEHKHFAVILVVGQTLVLWDPKVPAALDGYVQCRGHVREGLASKVILHTA